MFLKFPHSLDKLSGVPTSRTISGYNGTIADEKDYHIRLFQRALREGKIIMNAQYIHILVFRKLNHKSLSSSKEIGWFATSCSGFMRNEELAFFS